jgi:hypothetical protein
VRCGLVYTIDQNLHPFWLDLTEESPSVRWTLYFDLDEPSPRRRRDAIFLYNRAEDLAWNVTLSGTGIVRHGCLVFEL